VLGIAYFILQCICNIEWGIAVNVCAAIASLIVRRYWAYVLLIAYPDLIFQADKLFWIGSM